MTSKQYIDKLIHAERTTKGKDIPQESCAGVIDGLCDVIADKDTVIASKDELIAKQNQRIIWLERKVFGHSSEKSHADDPNWLSFDFGEEVIVPLSDEQLAEEAKRIEDTKNSVHKDAESRRSEKKKAKSREGQTYRIGPEIPRQEPVEFYPKGYDPETMVVIGWNRHEYLEIKKPEPYVCVEKEAICKLKDAKPTDAHTEIFEAKGTQNCLPGCIAGNKTMTTIITDKYCHRLPEYRQVKRFESMGIRLSTTSINRWQHSLADKLLPIYEQQMELVFSSEYQHLDESTIPINDQKHKTRKGYIWDSVDGMEDTDWYSSTRKAREAGR